MKKFRCHILAAVLAGIITIIFCPFSLYTFIHDTDTVFPYLVTLYLGAFFLIILIFYCSGLIKRDRIRIKKSLLRQNEPEEINNSEFWRTGKPFPESGPPVSSAFSHPFDSCAAPEEIPPTDTPVSRNRRP